MTKRARGIRILVWFLAVGSLLCAGCGGASDESGQSGSGKLQPADVRFALQTLPFKSKLWRVKGPAANAASFRGRALGPHNTTLEFSIGVGAQPRPIPVPGSGIRHVVWAEEFGFVFNDDSDVASKFKTPAQWRQVAIMAAEVNGSLCRAATGEPCPV
jgi:hypothetical protein